MSSGAHVWKFLEMELPSWCVCLCTSLLKVAKMLPKVSNPIYSLPPMPLTSYFSMFNSCQHLVFSDLHNMCQPESGGMIFHYYLNFHSSDYKWGWGAFYRACQPLRISPLWISCSSFAHFSFGLFPFSVKLACKTTWA